MLCCITLTPYVEIFLSIIRYLNIYHSPFFAKWLIYTVEYSMFFGLKDDKNKNTMGVKYVQNYNALSQYLWNL